YSNPFIFADVPDLTLIRVGDAFWMASTTMHMAPGVPIMKSYDLVNWETVSYCYFVMEDTDNNKLAGNNHMYSQGTWASSLRYEDGMFYLVVPSPTSGKTYFFHNDDPENKPWTRYEHNARYHDCGLLLDDDGRNWLVWNANPLYVIELNKEVTGVMPGAQRRTVISNLHGPDPITGETPTRGLAEGAQIEKIGDTYYIFAITWPPGNPRSVVCHRAKSLDGPWESKVMAMEGIKYDGSSTGTSGAAAGPAQGSIVDDGNGNWWGFAFRDSGPTGRLPWLMPITWTDGWPMFGKNADGTGSHTNLARAATKPIQGKEIKSIVVSDEFDNSAPKPLYVDSPKPTRVSYVEGEYDYNGSNLHLAWQWNHNPDNRYWTLTERPGWLRLKAMLNRGAAERHLLNARNTLTQRVFGPYSSAMVLLDVSNMKDGDEAGLALFAAKYGSIGVKMEGGNKYLVTTLSNDWRDGHITNAGKEDARIPLTGNTIHLKAEGDFTVADMGPANPGNFFYSYDGENWEKLGGTLNMTYSINNHFMGYRFALYNFAKTSEGGYADFDFFRVSDTITAQ
ncbi:MAG: glycoside hydrolase 43 family protein, partial [Planctomycetaceae bacterium]|nr:glycoside hydrolase 43 family protein [Planctomycetaceae bacterium]